MNPAKYTVLFMIITLMLASCNFQRNHEYLFDATKLSYRNTPEEVIRIIGEKPDSAFYKLIFGRERYILLFYHLDSTEFRFAKNKFLEAIVHKPNYPFIAQSITKLSLPFKEPSQIDTTAFIKWDHLFNNLDLINFYLVGSKVDHRSVRYKIYLKPVK